MYNVGDGAKGLARLWNVPNCAAALQYTLFSYKEVKEVS